MDSAISPDRRRPEAPLRNGLPGRAGEPAREDGELLQW